MLTQLLRGGTKALFTQLEVITTPPIWTAILRVTGLQPANLVC